MAVVLFSCLNPIGPFVCLTIHLFVILLLLSLSETAMSKMTFTSDRAQFAKLIGAVLYHLNIHDNNCILRPFHSHQQLGKLSSLLQLKGIIVKEFGSSTFCNLTQLVN